MTHKGQQSIKRREFNSLFLSLDEQTQDQALLMLKTLEYAQSVAVSRSDPESAEDRAPGEIRRTAV